MNCPRCGYDLRGTVDGWREACPLWGQCTECGVVIWWAEVLRPEKFEPQWCIEFVWRRTGLIKAALTTFFRSFRPFRFWTRVTMAMPVRPRRLALYVLMLTPPLLAAYAGMQTAAALRMRAITQQELAVQQRKLQKFVRTMPGSITPAPLPRPTLNHPWWAAILEAVTLPLASRSGGTVVTVKGKQRYPAPIWLHALINDRLNKHAWRFRRREMLSVTLAMGGATLWVQMVLPLTFVLLPVSRRRAKIRWRHLGRAWCYSLFIPFACAAVAMSAVGIGYAAPSLYDPATATAHFAGRWLPIALLVPWWVAAVRRYLRIPHAWAVVPMLAFLSFLLLPATMVAIFGQKLF